MDGSRIRSSNHGNSPRGDRIDGGGEDDLLNGGAANDIIFGNTGLAIPAMIPSWETRAQTD